MQNDTEASFLANSTDSLCLQVTRTTSSQDLVIFVLTTTTDDDRQTKPIALPLAHVCGVIMELHDNYFYPIKIEGSVALFSLILLMLTHTHWALLSTL